MGHWISFGITLAMMLGISIFIAYGARRRSGTHFNKWGPTYLIVLASVLVMADLVRHVLQDTKLWPEPSSSQYRPGCHDETFRCLSGIGIVFTIFCTVRQHRTRTNQLAATTLCRD
jgi:hypothetical protein